VYLSDEIADWSDFSDEWTFKLMTVPMFVENVTRPTRILPLSISNIVTDCERYNLKFPIKCTLPIIPDVSTTMTMSAVQFTGGSDGVGDGIAATT